MLDGRIEKESGEWLSMRGTVANNHGKKGMIVVASRKRSASHLYISANCVILKKLYEFYYFVRHGLDIFSLILSCLYSFPQGINIKRPFELYPILICNSSAFRVNLQPVMNNEHR
jgi:hypothetical protein